MCDVTRTMKTYIRIVCRPCCPRLSLRFAPRTAPRVCRGKNDKVEWLPLHLVRPFRCAAEFPSHLSFAGDAIAEFEENRYRWNKLVTCFKKAEIERKRFIKKKHDALFKGFRTGCVSFFDFTFYNSDYS